MIEAEMKSKIPKLENWEDVLTSNIFGLLELMDYKYLKDIISKSKNHKNHSIEETLKDRHIEHVELWKYDKSIGEPDVLVTLDDGTFFIIEVKYFSHEHNKKEQIPEDDEENSAEYNENGQLGKYLELEIDCKKSDFIIYLTADYQSLKIIENSESSSKECLDSIYHIHWNDFNEHLIKIKCDGIEKKIIDKIIQYLNFKGFTYWRGFKYEFDVYNGIKTDIGGFYGR